MQVKSIAECSQRSILQYFRPSLGCHLSLRSLLCLFLSGRCTQVLLCMHTLRVPISAYAIVPKSHELAHVIVEPQIFASIV